MKVYNQGILVAETRPEKNIYDLPYLWLIEGTPEELVPWDLFGVKRHRVPKVRMDTVMKVWLRTRVFPRERIGVENEIRALDLKEYDVVEIVKKTKGRTANDDVSIQLNDWEGAKIR